MDIDGLLRPRFKGEQNIELVLDLTYTSLTIKWTFRNKVNCCHTQQLLFTTFQLLKVLNFPLHPIANPNQSWHLLIQNPAEDALQCSPHQRLCMKRFGKKLETLHKKPIVPQEERDITKSNYK